MSDYLEIYGSNVRLPEKPPEDSIINFGLPIEQQKWVKEELPSLFEKVERSKDGKLILTAEQNAYAEKELVKCKKGIWIYIGGKLRYITNRYYFYLQYYILEDGNSPEFREADRLYFLFFEHWFQILWCLGIVRIKKRRQGASSQSCSNLLYEALFYKNSNCGLLSKTREDSKATFTEMVTNAYQQLPEFFKPNLFGKEDTVTELVLVHEKGALSKINYKAPVLNSYDRGRMSYVLVDEGGKYALDVPVSRLLAIISKTLVKGVKRVGWVDLPSTVNELTKGGGAEFKKVFDMGNQLKRKPTTNRVVRFFQPAYEAYEGFIDEFGDSVVDTPTERQYEYLVKRWVQRSEHGELISELSEDDIRLGAKVYVMEKRRDGLEGIDLEEEIRMNPCSEEEAFMYAGQGCEFNSANIQKQIKDLEEEPPYWRKMRLVEKKEKIAGDFHDQPQKIKRSVSPMDDERGGWLILEYPNKENHFESYGNNILSPLNKNLYQIGVDTTQDRVAVAGSNPAIVVFKKSCMVTIGEERVETGLYPVAIWDNPTRMDIHFDEEVLKAAMWYGCTAAYEIDRRNDFVRFFRSRDCSDFLEWTPKIMMNPLKPNKPKEPGQRSGDPFQLAQMLQVSKWYVDGDSMNEYNGHVHRIKYIPLLQQLLKYDHLDRTKSDLVVALQMALCAVFGEMQNPVKPAEVIQLFPQHKLKSYF